MRTTFASRCPILGRNLASCFRCGSIWTTVMNVSGSWPSLSVLWNSWNSSTQKQRISPSYRLFRIYVFLCCLPCISPQFRLMSGKGGSRIFSRLVRILHAWTFLTGTRGLQELMNDGKRVPEISAYCAMMRCIGMDGRFSERYYEDFEIEMEDVQYTYTVFSFLRLSY
ncbi:hypothetical protein BDZ97DRAFT_1835376 [Flammula alnicola]|nr:hypothetical protein BDZ97DRAFT_1835376 [Flammula alnicola]